METTDRRSLLEAIARAPETGDMARLKAMELLERLDDRRRPLPERPELEPPDEWIERVIAIGFDTGLWQPYLEARAQEIAAELTRERFAVFDEAAGSSESLADAETTDESSETQQAASEPETHPLDELTFRLTQDDEPPPSLLSRTS